MDSRTTQNTGLLVHLGTKNVRLNHPLSCIKICKVLWTTMPKWRILVQIRCNTFASVIFPNYWPLNAPIDEWNSHGTHRQPRYQQPGGWGVIFCAWELIRTQSRGGRHIDPWKLFGTWHPPSKVFLSSSEYLIASPHIGPQWSSHQHAFKLLTTACWGPKVWWAGPLCWGISEVE